MRLAVIAHIRHEETEYDSLLAEGFTRADARSIVFERVKGVLAVWEGKRIGKGDDGVSPG